VAPISSAPSLLLAIRPQGAGQRGPRPLPGRDWKTSACDWGDMTLAWRSSAIQRQRPCRCGFAVNATA